MSDYRPRCQNPNCWVPGGKILGMHAHPSVKTCRECKNASNSVPVVRAAKVTEWISCSTPGCDGQITAKAKSGKCQKCLRNKKIPCKNPECDNLVWKNNDMTSTGLCFKCYQATRRGFDKFGTLGSRQ